MKEAAVAQTELEAILADAPFVQQYGFRIHEVSGGRCTLYCPSRPELLRPDGLLSGPVMMAAADVAMWIAIIASLGKEAMSTVTTEMKTNFLSGVKGEDFLCEAKVRKIGSRLIFGTAECMTLDHKLLTHHSMTYIRPTATR